MTTTYPTGYGAERLGLSELFARHHVDKMHPEFARRLKLWLVAQEGRVGIGSSWRSDDGQPDEPGYAPSGKSFHQFQRFPSGDRFAAVDLVHETPGTIHRTIRWSEVPAQGSDEARRYGVHCNVGKPGDTYPKGEQWHMQPIEIDGWQSWVNAGRPDLVADYGTPTPAPTPQPIDPQPPTEDDMPTEFLTFHADPKSPGAGPCPVFATVGSAAVVWVSPEMFALHGSPTPRPVGKQAAAARVLLGDIDNGNPRWDAAAAMFDRITG